MIRIERPVGLNHLVSTLSEGSSMPPVYWRSWVEQVSKGQSAALLDETGAVLAVAGLYPKTDDVDLLWFCATPRARSRMVAICRLFRLTLLEACESRKVTVRAFVAKGWRPTMRFLALLDFRHCGEVAGFDVWDKSFGG